MAKKQKVAERPQTESTTVLVCSGGIRIRPGHRIQLEHKVFHTFTIEISFNKRITDSLYISLQPVPKADAQALVDAPSLGVRRMPKVDFLRVKRNAHPLRTYDWPLQRKKDTFRSLVKALEGHWDKPFDVLPPRAKVRVLRDFSPSHWDSQNAEQRKFHATQLDYQHDPATNAEIERVGDLVSKERGLKNEIRVLELMAVHSPLERESKERQLAELRETLAAIKQKQAAPAESKAQSEADAPRNRPPQQQRFQETEILRVLSKLSHTATALPENTPGKPGVKAAVRSELKFSVPVFNKAWDRLAANKEIAYALT